MPTGKLSRTPRFKRMYRRGYMFEKKTRAVITSILNAMPRLLFYVIESRGSKGKADLVLGLYNGNNGDRHWIGIQCKKGYISPAEQKRQIHSALKENGMIMFFALENTKTKLVDFNPDFKGYINKWTTSSKL